MVWRDCVSMDHKLFVRVFGSHDIKMPAPLLREQYRNQFPNAEVKMSKTFHIDKPKGPRGSFEAHYTVFI